MTVGCVEESYLSQYSKLNLAVFLVNPSNFRTPEPEIVSPFWKTALNILAFTEVRKGELAPGLRPLAQLSSYIKKVMVGFDIYC